MNWSQRTLLPKYRFTDGYSIPSITRSILLLFLTKSTSVSSCICRSSWEGLEGSIMGCSSARRWDRQTKQRSKQKTEAVGCCENNGCTLVTMCTFDCLPSQAATSAQPATLVVAQDGSSYANSLENNDRPPTRYRYAQFSEVPHFPHTCFIICPLLLYIWEHQTSLSEV